MTKPRPIWTGTITFGLVTIPIRLFTAVREERLAFHMLHDQDNVRLRRKLVCPADGKEIHPEHIVKGYEIHKNQYVVVRPEEIESCGPKSTRTVEITDFVDLAEIDPIYYDRPYYVLPQAAAVRPYRLLVEAMSRSNKVAISKVVMHEKEYLAALRPMGGVVVLHTMHFGNEVVPASKVGAVPSDSKVNERELKVADQLIESLASKFDPDRYHDQYKECVLKMIQRKAEGEEAVASAAPAEPKPATGRGLIAALEASVEKARGHRNGSAPARHAPRRRKSA